MTSELLYEIFIIFAETIHSRSTMVYNERDERHLHVIECAKQMKLGDASARTRLIESYLPMVAAVVRRAPKQMQTLRLVLLCESELEKAVDSFNFLQEGETFAHRLSWHMRQVITKCIVDSRL